MATFKCALRRMDVATVRDRQRASYKDIHTRPAPAAPDELKKMGYVNYLAVEYDKVCTRIWRRVHGCKTIWSSLYLYGCIVSA